MPRIFNARKFESKLSSLTRSKDSIQNISMWIIHHKNYCREIVNQWLKAFKFGDIPSRLTLFYVANDVLQHCKKKDAPEFREAFANVLEGVMELASDEQIKSEIIRMIDIWNKRCVYSPDFLKKLKDCIEGTSIAPHALVDLHTTLDPYENSPDVDPAAIANFRVKDFVFSLRQFIEFQKKLQVKCEASLALDDIEIPELSSIPLATHTQAVRLSTQMETMALPVQNCFEAAVQDVDERQKIIKQLEESQVYYKLQNSEVEIVAHAYKIFGRKVKRLQKMLKEKMSNVEFPEQTGTSASSPQVQVERSSPNCEDTQNSSLDKRLLSMFHDSALLGSQPESNEEFASGSTIQNSKNDEEMGTERNSDKDEFTDTHDIGNLQFNNTNSEEVNVNDDNLAMEEESQGPCETEIDEIMTDRAMKDIKSSYSITQTDENQVLTLNSHSNKSLQNASPLQNIYLPFNFASAEASNSSAGVRDSLSPCRVEAPFCTNLITSGDSSSPLKKDLSLDSFSVMEVNEISSHEFPYGSSPNTEVSKSALEDKCQQNVEIAEIHNQTFSSGKLLLKSARILQQLLTKRSQSVSKSTDIDHSENHHTMPLNSLINMIFRKPNVNSMAAANCGVNELESYLHSVKKEQDSLKNEVSRQQFKCDDSLPYTMHSVKGILDNAEFRNFIVTNKHNAKFQSLLPLLLNKSDKSQDLISKTCPALSDGVDMYSQNIVHESGEPLSSEKQNICDNFETPSIQIAVKQGQSDDEIQANDKNLEIMDMDVENSDDENLK